MANDTDDDDETTLAKLGQVLCSDGQNEAHAYATAQLRDAQRPTVEMDRVQFTDPRERRTLPGTRPAASLGTATEQLPPRLAIPPTPGFATAPLPDAARPPPLPRSTMGVPAPNLRPATGAPSPNPRPTAGAPPPYPGRTPPPLPVATSKRDPPASSAGANGIPADDATVPPVAARNMASDAPTAIKGHPPVSPTATARSTGRGVAALAVAVVLLIGGAGLRFGLRRHAASTSEAAPAAAAVPAETVATAVAAPAVTMEETPKPPVPEPATEAPVAVTAAAPSAEAPAAAPSAEAPAAAPIAEVPAPGADSAAAAPADEAVKTTARPPQPGALATAKSRTARAAPSGPAVAPPAPTTTSHRIFDVEN